MAEVGILDPEARVELLDGEIWDMSPIGDPHEACVDRLNMMLVPQVAGAAIVRVQSSVRISGISVPQPDLALLVSRPDFYVSGKPTPSDIHLLIEVADTTLVRDRDEKGPRYAESGIVEYWIVDLTSNQVLVYADPDDGRFTTSSIAKPGEVLSPRSLPSVSVAVSEVMGLT